MLQVIISFLLLCLLGHSNYYRTSFSATLSLIVGLVSLPPPPFLLFHWDFPHVLTCPQMDLGTHITLLYYER